MGKIRLIVEVDEKDFDRCEAWVKSDTFLPETRAIANGTPYPVYEGWNLPHYGYECPNCKFPSKDASPFCPECGADLRGTDNE